jgi:hypothetical protein
VSSLDAPFVTRPVNAFPAPALVPVPDPSLTFAPLGGAPPLPVTVPEPFAPLLPQLPLPPPAAFAPVVPQPLVQLVPVLVPPPPPEVVAEPQLVPCLVDVPQPLPAPVPLFAPQAVPGLCLALIPVVVPQAGPALFPALQGAILPAMGQVLPPGPFQDTPLQLLPVADNQYALVHPLLFCGEDDEEHCDDLADQMAAVAPGFGTSLMDGPDGYGVYLTYEAS